MYGPPPSDSDSDDFDGMSFGQEFVKKKKAAPPPRSKEDIVRDELIELLKKGEADAFRRLYVDNRDLINLHQPLVRYGWTPLMMACQAGLLELVDFFVNAENVDVNKSVETWTPLLLACLAKIKHDGAAAATANDGILEIVKLLIEHKALVNVRNRDGETALMLAIMNGYDAVVEYLMAHDASLEVTDNYGNTPLFYACTYGRKRIVELLMRNGIIYDTVNRHGDRPIDIAINKGFDDIEALFPVREIEETVPSDYLNYETIEELVPTAFPQRPKPAYAQDVFNLLRGMRLQKLDLLFYKAKIDLPEFLQMTNDRLQQTNVTFPYQRNRIIHGLMKIHSAPFEFGSLHWPGRNGALPEIFDSVSSCLKSLIICKTSLQFAHRKDLFEISPEPPEQIKKIQENINKLLGSIDTSAKNIHRKIKKLDQITPKAPLHIDANAIKRNEPRNTFKRIIFKQLLPACAFGLIIMFALKLRK